jgi:small GTP-binding protein
MSNKVKIVVDGEFDDQRVGHLNLLSPAELRRRMKACLNREEVAAVWRAVLNYDMEIVLSGEDLGTCIAALYGQAKRGRGNKLEDLLATLSKYSKLYEPLADASRQVHTLIAQAAKEGWKELDLSCCRLSNIPQDLANLTALESLNLAGNAIKTITLHREVLPRNLQKLDLQGNEAISISDLPINLTALTALDLSFNELTALPAALGKLAALESLDLPRNQLTALPDNLGKLLHLKQIKLSNNPLDELPPELRYKSGQAILAYYRDLARRRQLNEAKVLIVGQPTAGKTSLVKRLIEDKFDANEAMTEGINVKRWSFKLADDREVRLNMWDFGGQEIMHATHQFFLTKRSLYIILIDAREGEDNGKLEYWLKTAQKFGDNAPVLVVVNKIDIHPLHLNRRGLQDKYPMIKGFLEISCKDAKGIDQLKDVIRKQLTQLKHVDDELPETWFNVKQSLEEKNADYFSYKTFEKLCKEKKVRKESQETLIELLHDLGTVICFYKDWRLQDTHVLNPEWVTNGVYQIVMNRELIEAQGVLTVANLRNILPLKRYPLLKHPFIVEMMRKFELCFEVEGDQTTLLIPDLFPKDVPAAIELKSEGLLFNYQYDLLPSSIISRFIVRMKAYIQDRLYWRSGVKLVSLDKDNQALVWADLEQKKIYITVTGKEQGRQYLLQTIRAELQEINKSIPNLEITELIPLPEYGEEVEYARLKTLQKAGERYYIPTKVVVRIPISKILEGIEELQDYLKNTKGLVFLLCNRLDLDDIQMIWFLLFREKLDDVLPGKSLDNTIIEMIARAEKKQLLPQLLEDIITKRPDLKEDIDNLEPVRISREHTSKR